MKKLVTVILALVMTAGIAFASGGQNQGTTGSGSTYTGSQNQGGAPMPRTGR